nr:unnamed protein product [Digitaria exilis]
MSTTYDSSDEASRSGALRWLDEQPPPIAVEAPVTAENIRELAAGLELSGALPLGARSVVESLRFGGHPLMMADRGVRRRSWRGCFHN